MSNLKRRRNGTFKKNPMDSEILVGVKEKLKRWKDYVEECFNDIRPNLTPDTQRILMKRVPKSL